MKRLGIKVWKEGREVQIVIGGDGQEARARREEDHDRREECSARGKKVKITVNAEDAKMF